MLVSKQPSGTVGQLWHVPESHQYPNPHALAAQLPFAPTNGSQADVLEPVVHTYPVWEFRTIDEAIEYTVENWRSVADRYPGKPVVITEAGWTTGSSGRGIRPENASPALQAAYVEALTRWSREQGVLTFVFEAFDEPWKGAADPLEPEKHWGLFTVDRRPKLAVQPLYPDLPAHASQP